MSYFCERKCAVGGVACGAWADWFNASEDADPSAIDEERDPVGLEDFTFQAAECARPDVCTIYRESIKT